MHCVGPSLGYAIISLDFAASGWAEVKAAM
jgi:hypothetical protein